MKLRSESTSVVPEWVRKWPVLLEEALPRSKRRVPLSTSTVPVLWKIGSIVAVPLPAVFFNWPRLTKLPPLSAST